MSNPPRFLPFLLRIFFALPLILITAFSCFGFLATFEFAEWSQRLPWLAAYTLLGIACLAGVVALLRPRARIDAGHDAERQPHRR